MTWRIEMGDAVPMVAEVLGAQAAWKKLTKAGQAAVESATTDTLLVYAHPLTIKALERHGLVVGAAYSSRIASLTDAGRRLAYWNARTQ